jgi:hypothetical protein
VTLLAPFAIASLVALSVYGVSAFALVPAALLFVWWVAR